ncbi:MAG: TIM barrel protein [Planctomycetales bacterium]|nr:TIM barrel protein [Planctomycetales bacterium]
MAKRPSNYRFSFGPWNISAGADPFGPVVRKEVPFAKKIAEYRKLGFTYVQLHDDDVVPADWDATQTARGVAKVQKLLESEGLKGEFIAPRLWEDRRTIDGGYTANSASDRRYAKNRTRRAVDIANMMGIDLMVIWPAREGTYIREAKDAQLATGRLVEAINDILEHDDKIRVVGEMKPNEPMDHAYCPSVGHFMGLAYRTADPTRTGVLIESAHSILAGFDPADDMAYALWHEKLWGVHLNDQNGLKYDQDKTFGSVDLRRAFNQVWVLERGGYADIGVVGLDVKAMRTTKQTDQTAHLANSKRIFDHLVALARSLDEKKVEAFRENRDYEGLDLYIVEHLLATK